LVQAGFEHSGHVAEPELVERTIEFTRFMVILLTSSVFDEIAVQRELADQRINLTQTQRQLRVVFQVAAHEVVFARARFQSYGAGIIGGNNAVLFGQRQHPQDAAHRSLSVFPIQGLAQRADMRSGFFGSMQ
jgi:hypothetical protein